MEVPDNECKSAVKSNIQYVRFCLSWLTTSWIDKLCIRRSSQPFEPGFQKD